LPTVEELQQAEQFIIKAVQEEVFSAEIKILKRASNDEKPKRSSCLF
jgi:hypothetical protein